ncbi:MAG: CDP-diacylglycerol--serine O-phosphatidyltransferase [Deltaproteobacteria bacterium]|nr:CDP-diacylglycerol--serine O-phosphatidyltransferase [Deltaproteobacteria bacterium]
MAEQSEQNEGAREEHPEGRKRRFRLRRPQWGARRKLPFDLSKALFILPNAFTVASIFCGLYAILESTHEVLPGEGTRHLFQAGVAIFLAGFFDMFDGRVARMTNTQSEFGVQMDSLADAISFGVAPAVLVYKWGLQEMGVVGKVFAATYCACGVIRLARFNVLAARGEGSSRFFVGLPIPIAAAMLVSLVIAHNKFFNVPVKQHADVLALVIVLSYLMVSNVRYRTFKDFRPSMRSIPVVLALAGAGLFIALWWRASLAVVAGVGLYIVSGLVEEVMFYRSRQLDDPTKSPQKPEEPPAVASGT